MGIKFNGVTVKAMFVGDKPVVKVCVGGEQVWPADGYGIFNGGTVTEADGWRYHTFTESGLLEVVDAGLADVLVVDGGAGGAGGAGGGGMVWEKFGVNIGFDQPVTVGAGGAAADLQALLPAQPGGVSSLGELLVGGAAGGGGALEAPDYGLSSNGSPGTTGGGGAGGGPLGAVGAGGAGSAGGDGGDGQPDGSSTGGGGGAGGDGGDGGKGGDPYTGGDGGVGVQSAITGEWYGGGGGGGSGTAVPAPGGMGGGGNGFSVSGPAGAGAPNTGGGGGGGNAHTLAGAAGGSGVVVVRTRIPA